MKFSEYNIDHLCNILEYIYSTYNWFILFCVELLVNMLIRGNAFLSQRQLENMIYLNKILKRKHIVKFQCHVYKGVLLTNLYTILHNLKKNLNREIRKFNLTKFSLLIYTTKDKDKCKKYFKGWSRRNFNIIVLKDEA